MWCYQLMWNDSGARIVLRRVNLKAIKPNRVAPALTRPLTSRSTAVFQEAPWVPKASRLKYFTTAASRVFWPNLGPAPAGRGWDQQGNNFTGGAVPAQGYQGGGNAGGYGRGQNHSGNNWQQAAGNNNQTNNNFNQGSFQAWFYIILGCSPWLLNLSTLWKSTLGGFWNGFLLFSEANTHFCSFFIW